ncbi:LLM class F420-dependent oxidoreductase [Halioglobus japonicus]|uniref:LLM class F420-dependent oxidoreductase n=2 Tax=Halioglobus japonicus TaxID=930805 RepID=A0AAP8SN21_9GAMM|nr:TIGR03617 family F420-dependent LLM class oxidoreductase [Halioglobus japonicus]PLW85623.1 LLM class F420-dependent oxidoreductase [Halioglobus japonicus]GHD16600.1 LLM class F420-dependent oxidoreductase [Halioglobus japonicus]
MKVSGMLGSDLAMAPLAAAELENRGYDALFTAEINNDPFLPLLMAAEHSQAIRLTTSIAVAFARNPMTVAQQVWDINQFSGGRVSVGLGSQIKPHITRRFSMPWSRPAARMGEFVRAMKAIWHSWQTGEKLAFEGEFYNHTLMTPMFTPPNNGCEAPRVNVAAVGPLMTETAAGVADGMIAHGFTTPKYLREVTLPAVERGLETSGRERSDFEINCPAMVVCGTDEASFKQNLQAVKAQLGFYASTPAYRPVLELHGWGDLQTEANALTRQGRWDELGNLIDGDILDNFALVCEDLAQMPTAFKSRFGTLIDNWQCTFESGDAETQRQLLTAIRNTEN